ncbi:MAG: SDR family NAD(P)-dependent oxidoreductase [Spirochaetales bacterium]|nr:SDR family NAD(P)-dependent oxidoreductase [Spirochaetales bacterium]
MKKPRGTFGATTLVTGASSGLGRAISVELALRRCRLVLTGRQHSALEQTRKECLEAGAPQVDLIDADLTSPQERGVLWGFAAECGVEAVVNNAGAGVAGLWADQSWESDQHLLALLIEAPLDLAKRWVTSCRPLGRGALLNIVSTGAYQPGPYTAIYYAAKAFLGSWSLALSWELAPTGLVVTAAYPGALKSSFATRSGRAESPLSRSPAFAAQRIVRAWEAGHPHVVPGAREKLAVLASRLFPETWSAQVVGNLQASLLQASVLNRR